MLFLDLGNTLVSRDNITKKFIAFPETDTILSNLKEKGVEIGIISDGNRSLLNACLADPNLLNRVKVVVMSDDEEVGGIRKPKAKSLT